MKNSQVLQHCAREILVKLWNAHLWRTALLLEYQYAFIQSIIIMPPKVGKGIYLVCKIIKARIQSAGYVRFANGYFEN